MTSMTDGGENDGMTPLVAISEEGVSDVMMIEPRFPELTVKVSDGSGGFRDPLEIFCDVFRTLDVAHPEDAQEFARNVAEMGAQFFLIVPPQYVSCT